jgi:galactokinase
MDTRRGIKILNSVPGVDDLPLASVPSVRAPARVNIIGEHTDYNDGYVLPTTTALYTSVKTTLRSDRLIRVESREMGNAQTFSLDEIESIDNPGWIDYVKGVAAELDAAGVALKGADLVVESDIPLGGGLSSSASFELAVAGALLKISGESMDRSRIAKLCQRAEHRYAAVSCGIMDQYVIACCERDRAMLLDCRTLETSQISIPDSVRLVVTDSGVKHRLPESGYNRRSDECAQAVSVLAERSPEVTALRDANLELLESRKDALGELLYRRCRHVVSENQRVLDAVQALANRDVARLGQLISASQTSLRDDFEVSCEEVDRLIEIADASDGVLGSRMIGAGFGGCVLSLVEAGKTDEACRQVKQRFKEAFGREPWMHVVKAADPAELPNS